MMPTDMPARIRAAAAYGGLRRVAAAAAMNVSASHYDRYIVADPDYTPSWEQLWALADACGLPREWFSATLDHLHHLVPPNMPGFARTYRPDEPSGPGA